MDKSVELIKRANACSDYYDENNDLIIVYDYVLEKEGDSDNLTPELKPYQEIEINELIFYCTTNNIEYQERKYVNKDGKYVYMFVAKGVNND